MQLNRTPGEIMIRSTRIAIYADELIPRRSKTTEGILRYRTDDVVVVVNEDHAGSDAAEHLGLEIGKQVPIVKDLEGALKYDPDTLLLGMQPSHAELPSAVRYVVLDALKAGLNVISGLHYFLGEDPSIAQCALDHGVKIWDVRKPAEISILQKYLPRSSGVRVVLTVGSDVSVGKMTTALEMQREARNRAMRSAFIATGQIGLMISYTGVPADAILSDFVNGHVEKCVEEAASGHELVIVEGQAALNNPTAPQLTLGLIHGALPDAMILCHQVGRTTAKRYSNCPTPSLNALIEMNETAANWLHPSKSSRVTGVSLNTTGLDDASAAAEIRKAEAETGLPVCDVIRQGAGKLLDSVLEEVPS
jgi:uncharacterized NAD-dependent epimerase/dehydratase family protein